MSPISERELIRRYFAPLAGPEGLALTDDAARLGQEPGNDWVVNTDMIAEGVHFLDDPPEAIAAKALRVNLSDLAAKGADAFAYLMALGLSDSCDEAWVKRFAASLRRDQDRYGVHLIGGDTNRTAAGIVVSVTAIGRLPTGTMVRRSGARAGDIILVSGTIGDAALGLLIRRGQGFDLSPAARDHLLRRLRTPEPRTVLAPLIRQYATAAIDISDGLAGDLDKLCTASGLGASIDADKVPLSGPAQEVLSRDPSLREAILTGGDDYELLFAVAAGGEEEVIAKARETGVEVTPIGRIADRPGTTIVDGKGAEIALERRAYDHFIESNRT
jgi:thiamine-monophosphate kinase